jgi:glycosyltransferase involved in cell wall biosynthesis
MGLSFYFLRAILALYTKVFNNHWPVRLLISTQKKLQNFDVAISFLHNVDEKLLYGGCNEFVLHRVKAKEKITFLHCDFSNYGGNTPYNRKLYERFHKIAAVSEGCRRSFIDTLPKLATQTFCVYNCQNFSEYELKANNNPIHYPKEGLNIVTVARLSAEKGILRGIDVMNRLLQEGYLIRWIIVGEGSQRTEIEEKIVNSAGSKCIFLYGNQDNPYRFMKNADVFLLPSFHEAAPMVIDEAKCLGLPIIITDTTSAKERVAEGKEGFVCPNSEEGIYQTLKNLLVNPEGLRQYRSYLLKQRYSNEVALSQFQLLINEETYK